MLYPMMRNPRTEKSLCSRPTTIVRISRMSSCNIGMLMGYAIILVSISISFMPMTSAQRKNGKNRIDIEDEADVGMSLTLPKSEDVLLVPDEDEVRTDEDDPEGDDPEDLEDLENKRVLPIEDDVGHANPPDSGYLVNNDTTKSLDRILSNAVSTPRRNPDGEEDDDLWDGELVSEEEEDEEEEEETVSYTTSVATTAASRKPVRTFTIPPSFRQTILPALEVTGSPPIITKNPSPEIPYKINDDLTLDCESSVAPDEYIWRKDGLIVSISKVSGVLSYAVANDSMGGVYQCFAANSFGTAVSTTSLVRKAELASFPTKSVKINEPVVGQPLTLQCSPPRSYPKGFVYWSEEGVDQKLKAIENSKRVSLDYDGNLHFANVIMDDHRGDRKYVCVNYHELFRSNMQGDDQRIRPIPVEGGSPHVPPQLVWSFPKETRLVIAKHNTLRMKCIYSGNPEPTVSWSRIGGKGDSSHRMVFPNDSYGQEMIVLNVTAEDAGMYSCSASNPVPGSTTSKTFTIEVESAPYWRNNEPPQNVEVSEDGNAFFKCLADGYPKPGISWSLNGNPLNDLTPDKRRNANSTHLVFQNLTAADTQVIQCMAENRHGSLLANAYLFVKASAPELMIVFDKEVKVAEGKDVLLNCSATGFPSPVVHWTKNNTQIEASYDHFVLHGNGSLEIKDALQSDDDVYKCSATNKFGTHDTSGHLIVRDRTRLTTLPKSQTVLARTRVILECSAKTDPEEMQNLLVQWLKNEQLVDPGTSSGRIYQNSANSLVIVKAEVSDTGSYTCTALTPLDSDEFSADVVVQDRPDPPTNLELTPCGGNTTVSWHPGNDNNDKVTQYFLHYESSMNESGSVNISGSRPLEALVPLKPYRKYKFHITAQNSLGESDRTIHPADACQTPPSTPSKNPDGVCSETRGFKRLVILWQALTMYDLNGPGFRYVISYRRMDRPGANESLAITNWRKNELVIYDQEEFIPYEISVQSVNDVGPVPDETERRIAHSSEGTPIISPKNFRINLETLNSSSVEFQWDAINGRSELVKGFFRGYEIQFWKSEDPDAKQSIDVKVDAVYDYCPLLSTRNRRDATTRTMVSAVASGLWPFSQITAGVAVLNGAKVGNLSGTITFHTLEGVPGPVSDLRMTEVGSFHLKLRWNPPVNPNGIITGYVIRYIMVNPSNESIQEKNITDPLKPYGKLYPLQDDSLYAVNVYAKTSMGLGESASLQIKTLISGPPDKPRITDGRIGETSVNISWLPSESDPANPGSEFYVDYRRLSDNVDGWQIANPADEDDQWVNVTDLETGIEYAFVVVAVNLVNHTRSDAEVYKIGEQPTVMPLVSTAQPLWIIPIILIILIIVIIIILCAVYKRNKGGKYPVVEKEKEHGKAVAEEEKDFSEYIRRPEANHVQSRSSLISQASSEFSDDDLSLGEYDDPDTAKFTEDGSFIGRYVAKNNHDTTANRSNSHNTYV